MASRIRRRTRRAATLAGTAPVLTCWKRSGSWSRTVAASWTVRGETPAQSGGDVAGLPGWWWQRCHLGPGAEVGALAAGRGLPCGLVVVALDSERGLLARGEVAAQGRGLEDVLNLVLDSHHPGWDLGVAELDGGLEAGATVETRAGRGDLDRDHDPALGDVSAKGLVLASCHRRHPVGLGVGREQPDRPQLLRTLPALASAGRTLTGPRPWPMALRARRISSSRSSSIGW